MLRFSEEWRQESGLYRCPYCEQEFSQKGIGIHVWSKHDVGQKSNRGTRYRKEKCDKCGQEISTSQFKRHQKTCEGQVIVFLIQEEWKQVDGRYKCPQCEFRSSKKGLGSHIWRVHGAGKGTRREYVKIKNLEKSLQSCVFCRKEMLVNRFGLKSHQSYCVKYRDVKHLGKRTDSNKDRDSQKSIVFRYHKKECVICGESFIIAKHHYDGNRKNNHPMNFVPLCPTHHQYWHSRYRSLIRDQVVDYLKRVQKDFRTDEFFESLVARGYCTRENALVENVEGSSVG